MDYENTRDWATGENKPNSNPNAGLWPETRSTKCEILNEDLTEHDLKKQSQCVAG
jgi:hypothetical protein